MASLYLQNKKGLCLAFLFVCVVFVRHACPDEFYSLRLDIEPVDEVFFDSMAGASPVLPDQGMLLVAGSMDHPGFYVESLNNVSVESSDGTRVPLMVDMSSLLREFDGVVAGLFAFSVPENHADEYKIVWGSAVEAADNILLDEFKLDPERAGLYRQFRWTETLASGAEDTPFSTIVVIADSTAEYHFLWYLLPIGLVFILLTFRRFFLRDPSA